MKQSFFLILILPFLFSNSANAQMFSVGDSEGTNFNPFAPYIRAGVSTVDFTYVGEPGALGQRRSLSMDGSGIYLGFESFGLNANVTLLNSLTGQDNQSFLQLALMFNNPFPIVRRPGFTVAIPFQLSTQLTSVQNDNNSDEFSQTGLSAGLGAMLQFRAQRSFSFTTEFIPSYGFSSSSGGFFGGSVFGMDGKARLNFFNLLFNRNISFGFDYKFNSYDIDEEEFDYELSKLTFTLGVSL